MREKTSTCPITKSKVYCVSDAFKSANLLPFDGTGWLPYPDQLKLEVKKVVNSGGKVFVELGSWLGLSTRLIASVIPNDAKLYAIDTWKGSPELIDDPRLPMLYEIFLSNCIRSGLAHKIYPLRMTTNEAAKIFYRKIDFLFIDATHTYEAVYNDIMNWYPKLSENGVICGDDWKYSEYSDDVRKAAMDAARLLNISVGQVPNAPNFWKMDRRK
jgi:predicted O-methyltransferase YrrM